MGGRVADLERRFNWRHGAGTREDRLPAMFMDRSYGSGEKLEERYEVMLEEYYDLMGWDEEGRPAEAEPAAGDPPHAGAKTLTTDAARPVTEEGVARRKE